MKTRNTIFITLSIALLIGLIFFLNKEKDITLQPEAALTHNAPKIDTEKLQIDGKKIVGLTPGKEKVEIKNLHVKNSPSLKWKEKLEEALEAQAGSSISEIEIKKIDSFIWAQDGVALNVESAIVTIKDEKKQSTTFRVLVDSQTGKILKNWDQPIIDPINPRENFGIKLDPRYHND